MADRQIPRIAAHRPSSSLPQWAVLQRSLIALMDESEDILLEHYLKPNGELFWPDVEGFRGYGGVDNAFEGFHRWPLLYLLGGSDRYLELAHRQVEALTAQFSRYGLLTQEYLAGYDWMHQGEAALLFYLMNLADPGYEKHRERSIRFAGFLVDGDPSFPEPCYDPEHNVFKTAYMGSKGPVLRGADDPYDYATYMDGYGLAFYDVPGVVTMMDLQDPDKANRYGQIYSARLGRCDTVTNMLATSMVTNAYLQTGDDRYRQWVIDYVGGWRERYANNGGIMPDNAGPTGKVGETMDGKWYGGHYGWTFPHGFMFIGDALVVGGESERLLSGAAGRLEWVTDQVQMLLSHAIEDDDGRLLAPCKYADSDSVIEYRGGDAMTRPDRVTDHPGFTRRKQIDGWFEFRGLDPSHMAHVYADSRDPLDLEVATRIRNGVDDTWSQVSASAVHGKYYGGQHHAYLNYLGGGYRDYPVDVLRHSIDQVYGQLSALRDELEEAETGWGYRPGDDAAYREVTEVTRQVNAMKEKAWSETVTHDYFQTYLVGRSTLTTEALVHLTMGGPMPIYNGGLLMVSVRHYDAERRRPGLPADVAALVRGMDQDGIDLTLVNLHPTHHRTLIVQAGAYAEHSFTKATYTNDAGEDAEADVEGEYVEFDLGPGVVFEVNLGLRRFCRQPSYQQPWD